MPPPRHNVKINARKGKAKTKPPESADEYLAAGVELEEAGEKWRAGDPAKSTRFFLRAIDNYDAALRDFPGSFDLAYNKARVQYQITQHPALAAEIPTPLVDLLRTALESHRYALKLREDNADVLFNTAQVLTSLAEALVEGRGTPDDAITEALALLEESLSLFQRCLSVQEFQFSEAEADREAFEEDQDGDAGVPLPTPTPAEEDADMPTSQSEATEEEDSGQWAYVMEPVTVSTLLDTALAQLSTLTTMCSILSLALARPSSSSSDSARLISLLNWIDDYSTTLFQHKITAILNTNPTEAAIHAEEVSLARANFRASLSDASYRASLIDAPAYLSALTTAFSPTEIPNLSSSPALLTAQAEALITFNNTLALNHSRDPAIIQARWTALTTALSALTTAAKLPNLPPAETAPIHLLRGNLELLRARLADAPWNHPPSIRNKPTLLRNAEIFFRGAKALATTAANAAGLPGAWGGPGGSLIVGFESPAEVREVQSEAAVKEALVQAMTRQGVEGLRSVEREVGPRRAMAVLEEVVEEGMVGEEAVREVLG